MNISVEQREELHSCALELAENRPPPGWELVRSSDFTRVASNAEQRLYYKEFLPRGPAEPLKTLIRGSRATRARKNGNALLRAGFPAPLNVAWGNLARGREYLFTRAAAGIDVARCLGVTLAGRAGPQLHTRRHLLHALGAFIGRLHANGFIHGDLRPGNILADLRGESFHFTLIDNERTVRKLPPPGKLLLKNLMQLNMLPPTDLSLTDRMRFLRAWHQQNPELSAIEVKVLGSEAYHWAMLRLYSKGVL